MTHHVIIQPSAAKMLSNVADRRIREKIGERIDGLVRDPDKQGKPLVGELLGHRSLRAAGQRYRILYEVVKETHLVNVVAVGIRKAGGRDDIYALAQKLLRLHLV